MRAVRAISCVPIASPEASRDSTSASRPLAITVLRPLLRGALGGENLGQHAASAEARDPRRRPSPRVGRAGIRLLNQRRVRIFPRIGGEKPLLIGEDDERVALDQVRDERAERVVVAELDFVGDDRVVLVDDRHHAERATASAAWSARSDSARGPRGPRASAGFARSECECSAKRLS